MEKFSQFRDRGSGISPFMPATTESSTLASLASVFLFLLRLPFFVTYSALYFLVLHHLPLPAVVRKLLLWTLLAIPGIWWVDLQLDGVKRGSLSQQPPSRVPHPRSIIAANFTSPIDALYLAAVFDPVFVVAYPHSRKVRPVGLFSAVAAALSASTQFADPPTADDDSNSNNNKNKNKNKNKNSSTSDGGLTDLGALVARHPDRVVAVFPECGTTNGKGVLPLSPCLLAAAPETAIFPVSMRYTPPDITTPLPGGIAWAAFLWRLLGRSTHTIRVRIAEGVHNTTRTTDGVSSSSSSSLSSSEALRRRGEGARRDGEEPTEEEQRLLDRVAEALARLGRAKRVGLTLRDKKAFVAAWNRRR